MNIEQIAVIPPYLVNSPKAGYYDRYAAKVDLELKLNFWAWMKYERICLILGDFLLVYKDEQPYTQYPLNETVIHVWIHYKLKPIGEMTFELHKAQHNCYIHLIRIFEEYRYQRYGTTIIYQFFNTMLTRMFNGREDATLTGVATPIEGQEFWKRCGVEFKTPIKGEPYELGGEIVRDIKGYPFVFNLKSFRRLES